MKQKAGAGLRALFDVREMPLFEREKIEIVRKGKHRCILLCGVQRILQYDESEMKFALRQESVSVIGKNLICTTYADGAVSVEGDMESIRFHKTEEMR